MEQAQTNQGRPALSSPPRVWRHSLCDQLGRALLALTLAACAPPPNPPPPAAAPPTAPPGVSAAPAAPVAPAAPAGPPSPFSLFTEGWEVAVADVHGPVVIYDGLLGAMVTVEGEQVTRVDRPFYGLPAAVGTTGTLTGRWPEGALLTIRGETADRLWKIRGVVGFFRRTEGRWEALDGIGRRVLEGLELQGPDDAYFDARVAKGPDGRSFVLPYPYDARPRIHASGANHRLGAVGDVTLRSVRQMEVLGDGEIALLGEDREKHAAIQRSRPGRPGATLTRVPDVPQGAGEEVVDARMCAAADDAVHLVGWSKSAGLAFLALRGSAWEVSLRGLPVRERTPVAGCAIGRDGSVWLVLRSRRSDPRHADAGVIGELFRRSPSGEIERVPYPALPPLARRLQFERDSAKSWQYRATVEEIPPSAQGPGRFQGEDVFVADDGGVWLSGRRTEQDDPSVEHDADAPFELTWRVVLRLGPPLPGAPIDWGGLAPHVLEARLAAQNVERNQRSALYPAQPTCASFLRLGSLPKAPPAREDFASVRALVQGRADLAGTRFIEARVEGEQVLGALVPDPETGQRLFAIFKGRIPGAKLYCGSPRVLRVIPMGVPGEP